MGQDTFKAMTGNELRVEKFGLSVAAVAQQTALTTDLTALTHTAPGTPDYAIQQLIQPAGFGFVSADEGNTVLKVIAANAVRIAELESKLQALGLIA